ncbi:hypothetical protein DSECCO2_342560 [anaerobic digester metagenome]
MCRRIWFVLFSVTIRPEERDETIAENLFAERSGILNWCLGGLARYRDGGRLDVGVVSRFVDEECVITGVPDDREVRSELYAGFPSWAKDNGVATVTMRKFADLLKSRGVIIRPGPRPGDQCPE